MSGRRNWFASFGKVRAPLNWITKTPSEPSKCSLEMTRGTDGEEHRLGIIINKKAITKSRQHKVSRVTGLQIQS